MDRPQKRITVRVPREDHDTYATFRALFQPGDRSAIANTTFILPIFLDQYGPHTAATDGTKYRAERGPALVAFIQNDTTYIATPDADPSHFTIVRPDGTMPLTFFREGTQGHGNALPHYTGFYDAIFFCVYHQQVIVVENERGAWRLPQAHELNDAQVLTRLNSTVYAFNYRQNTRTGYTSRVYAADVDSPVQLEAGQRLVPAAHLFARIMSGNDSVTAETVLIATDMQFRHLFTRNYLAVPCTIPAVQRVFPFVAHDTLAPPSHKRGPDDSAGGPAHRRRTTAILNTLDRIIAHLA